MIARFGGWFGREGAGDPDAEWTKEGLIARG